MKAKKARLVEMRAIRRATGLPLPAAAYIARAVVGGRGTALIVPTSPTGEAARPFIVFDEKTIPGVYPEVRYTTAKVVGPKGERKLPDFLFAECRD